MEYIVSLLVVLFTIPGIFSDAFPRGPKEELPDILQCDNYCHHFHRVCLSPPFLCGGCRHNFINHDGECLPYDGPALNGGGENVGPDREIDALSAQRAEIEDSNAIQSEQLPPQGKDAQIPDNAQIHRIIHGPGFSNDRKVQDVYKLADAQQMPTPSALRMDMAAEKKSAAIHDVASMADVYFLAVVAGCSIAGVVGLVVAGVCWYRLQKNVKASSEVEYPAYGVTGPTAEKVGSPGDRKLAQSAQMYHYQHQKQQMIAMEKANGDMTKDGSDADSDEENEEGDYTVYECPGLAPTGEMEVKNPLFAEETPVTPLDANLPPK